MAGPASGKHKPAYVTFSQDLVPEYWPGWDPMLITSGDPKVIMTEVVRRCDATASKPAQAAWGVVHDHDMTDDRTLRGAHLHGILQQSKDGGLFCDEIDKALGFTVSVVRAPARGGRIENAQSYLIHAKDPDKHQYDPKSVATVRGRDYLEIEASFRRQWARRAVIGRDAAVVAREWSDLADALIQKVLDGEVDELDILRDKTFGDIYARGQAKIDLALSFRARREMHAEVERFRAGVFTTVVVWILGASEQGKSWLAQGLVEALERDLGWTTYRAAARNGPDEYHGQHVFWFNEPGPRVMEWSDLLTLLDPYQAGPISARYRNKGDAAPRVVLVSVAVDPVDFGFFVPGKRSTDDSLDQLVRRIALQVTAQKVNGVPRYTVSQIGAVPPYERRVRLPVVAAYERVSPGYETLQLGYGPTMTVDGLDRDVALDAIVGEIVSHSTDLEFAPSGPPLTELNSRQHLAARGIVIHGPIMSATAA